MPVSTVRSLRFALAAPVFIACASSQSYSSSSAGGSVDLSAYPAPSLSGSELQVLRGMSDANILAHVAIVDSIEVATADSALRFAMSDDVVDYAKLMHLTHEADFKHAREMSGHLGGSLTDVSGLTRTHLAASLDSVRIASAATINRHYIMSQVQLHEHMLAELETLRRVARDPMVRTHVIAMIPVVRDHLARAHAVAISNGLEARR